MAQATDFTIANQSFPNFRTDLNSVLSAINTMNSGTSRPSSAVAGTMWLDTTSASSPTIKFFDGSDDISFATIDYSANTVNFLDSTVVADLVADTTPQLGGNLDVNGNDIVSTSNANIDLVPNGTGDVTLQADTVQIGDSNANATLTTNGTGDLILNTNAGTNSGNITIADGANGLLALIFLAFFAVLYDIDSSNLNFSILISLVSFTIFNVTSGRIFLGDFGAYFLSSRVAFKSLEVYSSEQISGFFLAFTYIVLLLRIFRVAFKTEVLFESYLCLGIGIHLLMQASINMLVCVGFVPVTGQNMPFLAMGGSALIMACVSVGIVQSIARNNNKLTATATSFEYNEDEKTD